MLEAFCQFSLVPLVAEFSPEEIRPRQQRFGSKEQRTRQPRSGLRHSVSTSDLREKRKEFMLIDVDDELEVPFPTRSRGYSVSTLDVRENKKCREVNFG